MNILLIGGGGREHALAWKIKQSPLVNKIFCIPGNAGIAGIAECIDLPVKDFSALAEFAHKNKIDWTLIGPEQPLVDGIVDMFQEKGFNIFGPRKKAAVIEGSKIFAKKFMEKHKIPTSPFKIFEDAASAKDYINSNPPSMEKPSVIKADGLAAGKGVIIAKTPDEAIGAVEDLMLKKIFGEAGSKIIIEEFLKGEEATVLIFTDGENFLPLISSQDHKKIYEGEKGPNTGGMGAYAPAPVVTKEIFVKIKDKIIIPTLKGLAREGRPYQGVLYIGLIIADNEPSVLEYNVRFGDPETQAVLPLLETDLMDIIPLCRGGGLKNKNLKWKQGAAVCVVLSAKGYPGEYEKDKVITGLDKLKQVTGISVFHAGTKFKKNSPEIVTSGGRVLGVTAIDEDIETAINKVYGAVNLIHFEGMHFRSDIGQKARLKIKQIYNQEKRPL